jgi:hypothetical protein
MSSASTQWQDQNDWHTVAMARQGDQVWVHDPAYVAASYAGTTWRADAVHDTRNVHELVQAWAPVQGVHFQGPPSTYTAQPSQLEFMGRSAQWVEAMASGMLP